MIKPILILAAVLAIPAAATAQTAPPVARCPAGSSLATIRHSLVKPGKWPVFAQAVTDHTAWYAARKSGTGTALARIVVPATGGLSTAEAVTITRYDDKPQPAHDDAYDAFIAKYRDSSTLKDEARICLPR